MSKTYSGPPMPPGKYDVPSFVIKTTNMFRWKDITEAIKERDAFGKQKYGGPLESHNGLNPGKEAREELFDWFQYIGQAYLEEDREALIQARHDIARAKQYLEHLIRSLDADQQP